MVSVILDYFWPFFVFVLIHEPFNDIIDRHPTAPWRLLLLLHMMHIICFLIFFVSPASFLSVHCLSVVSFSSTSVSDFEFSLKQADESPPSTSPCFIDLSSIEGVGAGLGGLLELTSTGVLCVPTSLVVRSCFS